MQIDKAPSPWAGRDDGPGCEHERWYNRVQLLAGLSDIDADAVTLGFASDEGVARNLGRVGAAAGPATLRAALATLALGSAHRDIALADAGDIEVTDSDLEGGQERLGCAVATLIDAGSLPLVLGGGHEVAFGTYSGVASSQLRQNQGQPLKLGILNLDAHFDLRQAARPSSGTPFRQALEAEKAAGTQAYYAVIGIAQPANTQVLFDTAHEYGVRYLLDEEAQLGNLPQVESFVENFLADIDVLYLTLDLDALPAAVAPGVSAPAAYGIPLEVVLAVIKQVAASGKLLAFDVAELNPGFDIDGRTAKTAARIIHTLLTHYQAYTRK
ncbi:MAG: formimidoylglutamase [Rothia sp. (in: high G+C Gram-positive bacteria)]|nr:formimidoylglutamase [Rothia sp. (in: high G+C Gram-positive bacteria)]